jgi:hypothetical protein
LDSIPGAFQYVTNSKTFNLQLAESFQNYVLNLETMITSFSTYDSSSLQTVSERVFFKWLKEIGAIRFRESSTSESPLAAGLRFTEEDPGASYKKVVQYIGEIDVVNSVKRQGDAYSEIYVHVPTKDGATPLILFKSLNDANYFPGQNLINSPSDPLNTEFLFGRNFNQVNPAGLDTHAFFDSDFQTYGASVGATSGNVPTINTPGQYQLFKYNASTNEYVVDWWFPYPEANSYWTQPPASTGSFDDPTNDSLMIRGVKQGSSVSQDVSFQRSRLDGIMIDFDTSNYLPISSNPAIQSFSDFNSLPETVNFDFNAVLVYYDIEDINTGAKATNLFGILFLDNVEDTLNGGIIPTLTKYKPNKITGLNGNAYGFKINLKFDVNTETASVVTAINEYSPFSMQLWIDALNTLQGASDTLTAQNAEIENIVNEIETIKGLLYNGTDLQELDQRITQIETQLENSRVLLDNSESLNQLIARNYEEILNIYKNNTSITVQYNTDVLQAGEGIILDKSVPNQVIVKNVEQTYTFDTPPIFNVTVDFTSSPTAWIKVLPLQPFGNYVKLSNGTAQQFDKDVNLYIDDTTVKWKKGQTMKIVVDHNFPMDMYTQGSFDLVVYTDALDILNTGQNYSKEIARVSSSEFYEKNGKPQIEIICLNPETLEFTYDLI